MALTPDSKAACNVMFCTNALDGACEIAHLVRTQAQPPNEWSSAGWGEVLKNARKASSCKAKEQVQLAIAEAKPVIVTHPLNTLKDNS